MKKQRWHLFAGMLLAAGALAGLAAAETPQASSSPVSAFALTMRILEGSREAAPAPSKPVTSSYLKFMNFSNYELEEDLKADQQIKKLYGLKDLGLIAAADLAWEKGKNDKALYMFRLNGQEYLLIVTPGRLPEKNQFRIEVHEQSGARRASLLDTEFSLPEKTAAVFGFENTEQKPYFITLRVARWVGGPAAAGAKPAGGTVGGVVGGVVRAGSDKVKPPKLIKEVKPVYPEEASKAGVAGVVIMEATTDTYGRVASIKVLRGIPLLNQAAMDALRQWVYEPMVIDGKPQPVVFTVTMQFKLDGKKKPQVEGGVSGGVAGGVQGGVEGGVAGGVAGGVEGDAVRAVGKVQPPKLVKEVKPAYPKEAAKARVEGVVILEAKADEQGNVIETRVLRSIPLLDQAAIDAVKQWKYEPMLIDGKPHKVVFTVTVRFTLDEGKSERAADKFAEGAVKATGDIKPPKLLKEVLPVYPEIARQAGVEGVVILSVKTDETGKVMDTMILRSIPLLDQAAIDAVRQWVYEPFVHEGKAQPIVFTATVRFQLKENIVKPGATLDIAVEGLPSLDGFYKVSPAGSIDFKLLGEVPVVNLSSWEVGEFLASELDKKYTKNVKVSVALRKN